MNKTLKCKAVQYYGILPTKTSSSYEMLRRCLRSTLTFRNQPYIRVLRSPSFENFFYFIFFLYASKRLSVKLDVQIKAWMSGTTTAGLGPALLTLTRGVIALLHCWNVTAVLIPGGLFHQLIKAIGTLSQRQSTMTWYDTTLIKIKGLRVMGGGLTHTSPQT